MTSELKKYDKNGKELAIRFALGAIKAVGIGIMEDLVVERNENGDFKDIFDFAARLGGKVVNKKSMEALAKAGAFDKIHGNRRQIVDSCEVITRYASSKEEEKKSSQMSLFGGSTVKVSNPVLEKVNDWNRAERLQNEFEAFGFFLEEHPLDVNKEALRARNIVRSSELDGDDIKDGDRLRLAGVVSDIRHRSSNRGRFAYLYLSDPDGIFEVMVFSEEIITSCRNIMVAGVEVMVDCIIKKDDGGNRLLLKDIKILDEFIKTTKPGSLPRTTSSKKFDSNRKWQKKGEGQEYSIKKDPIVKSATTPAPTPTAAPVSAPRPIVDTTVINIATTEAKVLSEILIHIDGMAALECVEKILKQNVAGNDSKKTHVYVLIEANGEQTLVNLGSGYSVGILGRDQLSKTFGVKQVKSS